MSAHEESFHQDIPSQHLEVASQHSELATQHSPEEEINQFVEDSFHAQKETFDRQSFKKKCNYLSSLQNSNRSLFCKIKEIDDKLNNEVQKLSRKHPPTQKAPYVPRLDEMQTQEIRYKYGKLQECKSELQQKKLVHESLRYLSKIKEDFWNKQTVLEKEISQQKQHLKRLNKIKQKQMKQEEQMQSQISSVGQIDIYEDQITELRARIKSTTTDIKASKDRFLSRHQKKSNRSTSTQAIQPEVVDEELLELKRCYEAAGRRIEALKAQRQKISKK